MIYFRIEMWPYGDHEKRYTLTEGTIANVGGDTDTGHYTYAISSEGGFSGTDEEIAFGDALGVDVRGEERFSTPTFGASRSPVPRPAPRVRGAELVNMIRQWLVRKGLMPAPSSNTECLKDLLKDLEEDYSRYHEAGCQQGVSRGAPCLEGCETDDQLRKRIGL